MFINGEKINTGNTKSTLLAVLNSDGRKLDMEKRKAISRYSVEGKGHRTSSRVGEKIRKITSGSLR